MTLDYNNLEQKKWIINNIQYRLQRQQDEIIRAKEIAMTKL